MEGELADDVEERRDSHAPPSGAITQRI